MCKRTSLKGKQLLIGISVLSSLSFVLTGCSGSNNLSTVYENNKASELDGAIKENLKTISDEPRTNSDLTNIIKIQRNSSDKTQQVTADGGLADPVNIFDKNYSNNSSIELIKSDKVFVQSFSYNFDLSTASNAENSESEDISSLMASDIDYYLRNKLPIDATPESDNPSLIVMEYTTKRDIEKEVVFKYKSNIVKKRIGGSGEIKVTVRVKNYNTNGNGDRLTPFYYLNAVYTVNDNNSASKM
ncbi:hypothetical protein O0Q50_22375 [Priestia aryabhattai]|uniref:Lipoprotein n=1 Tax=Priestia aryabhattai TaxID=412384 RepID=A0AAX6NE54_PRIAR|nr:hypothetical protein [Priestia aryabhattai]MDU9693930.1 hypothetical protein [Priestia aryabhattai]NGY88775.1 hypothetical protein [Priestia megaterium]